MIDIPLLSGCCVSDQSLNLRNEGTCGPKYPLQDENHFGHGPRSTSGFPCHFSEKFPERFPIAPKLVVSKETLPISTERLKFDSLLS